MGWKCSKCGKSTASDSMQFPIMHGYECDGDVQPDIKTAIAWARVI